MSKAVLELKLEVLWLEIKEKEWGIIKQYWTDARV